MPINDYGLVQVGSFFIGSTPTVPSNLAFGTGSEAIDNSAGSNYLNNELESVSLTKTWIGNSVQYSAFLSTVQGNGSSIGEIGVGTGSPTGSTLWSRDLSAIGDKDNTFSVTVYLMFKVSRG